ncbi:hypothetical protein [Streptomyces sp. CC0208]|nr:hypothetical protein [Streptomyces sp. CC0208]
MTSEAPHRPPRPEAEREPSGQGRVEGQLSRRLGNGDAGLESSRSATHRTDQGEIA